MRRKLTKCLASVLASAMIMTSMPVDMQTAKAVESNGTIVAVESVSYGEAGEYEQSAVPFEADLVLDEEQFVEIIDGGATASVLFRFIPQIRGNYVLHADNNCYYNLYDENMEWLHSASLSNGLIRGYVLEAGETYYYEIGSPDSCEVSIKLTKEPMVVSASVLKQPKSTSFYYALEKESCDGLTLRLRLDTGQLLKTVLWDETWDQYGIKAKIVTPSGEELEYAEDSYINLTEVGDYFWKFIIPGVDKPLSVPFEILDPAVAMEDVLSENSDSISLKGIEPESPFTGPCNWVKLIVKSAGTYEISSTDYFGVVVKDQNNNTVGSGAGNSTFIYFEEAGTYFALIRNENDAEFCMSKKPELSSMTLSYKNGEPECYAGLFSPTHYYNDIKLVLKWTDGTKKNIAIDSDEFYDYGLEINLNCKESHGGKGPNGDSYALSGKYVYVVNDMEGNVSNELVLTAKDRTEMPLLKVGETLSGLQKYKKAYSYFRIKIKNAGSYYLDVPFKNYQIVWYDEKGKCYDTWVDNLFTINASGPVEYYIRIKNNNGADYAVSLHKESNTPAISALENKAQGITVKWNKVSGATGYEVYRKQGSGSYKKIKTITSESTISYMDKNIASGQKYTYAVKAVKGKNTSSLSSGKSITYLSTPVISGIISGDGKAKLTWNKVSGAEKYIVYRKNGNTGYKAVKTIAKGSDLSYIDSTVKSGKTYTYAVQAVKGASKSAYSTEKSVKVIKDHKYEDVVTKKATNTKNGTITSTCELCGKTGKKTTVYAAKTVKLAEDSYTYDGKAKKPSVTVKDSKGKKINSSYYTVSYKNNKAVGTATVTIKFKGRYSGKVSKTFTISPKGTTISKVTAAQKGFTVEWKKQNNQTTGYQIQYSTDKNFKSSTKTVTMNKNTTVSQKVTELKANKKYYIRVRTFKKQKVNGKSQTIYSVWSSAKSVTTKK